ncbi:DUF3618 domain-containing protein [Paracoccus stylophorae]|uniref:DUF3618 domain-containing protein n=1 Tax=Paracoccus stylophorae TaxID=659350 RepID=A0ABY7STE5_9RHOB|nr:DUF3618 domain-containing protein [Paracoccus stylophorae]WCR10320.1 DUF3618 domain-containing protein [Paracoccus stylophorae]
MTNETRSPEEIEREIEQQRSELTSTLDDLQDRFSIDGLVRQIGEQFREHGGDMSRSITNQIKANPIPLALTGIGLAWMMFGNSRPPAPASPGRVEEDYRRARLDHDRPYTRPTSQVAPTRAGPAWARDDHDVQGGSDGYGSSIGDTARSGAQSVKDGLSSAGSAASDAASSAGSTIAEGAESVRDSVAAAGNRIAEGTEALTEEGRKRVIAARQKALEMRRSTSQSVAQGADAAADFYDRQPLVVGALALAFGAALGGALPRTRVEDDLMGEQSDHLIEEAERIFEEEKAKAKQVAESVTDEVKDIASETKSQIDSDAPGDKTAAEALGDKAKDAARRVEDTAKTAAKDENLGKPRTD